MQIPRTQCDPCKTLEGFRWACYLCPTPSDHEWFVPKGHVISGSGGGGGGRKWVGVEKMLAADAASLYNHYTLSHEPWTKKVSGDIEQVAKKKKKKICKKSPHHGLGPRVINSLVSRNSCTRLVPHSSDVTNEGFSLQGASTLKTGLKQQQKIGYNFLGPNGCRNFC